MLEQLGGKLYTKLPMAMGFPEDFLHFLHSFRLTVSYFIAIGNGGIQ